jgi:G patch domain-containing protein 1
MPSLTTIKRGSLLGETPLPAAPRSVFEYLSKKDRERIQNITSSLSSQPIPSLPPPDVPRTEAHIAQAALRGFQPFEKDPVKHARYTAYLISQASTEDSKQLQPSPGQSREDFAKEISDYAKSAQLFKPMSGAMAGRFTSAAVVENGPKIIEGLHQPSAASSAKPDESSTDTSAAPGQEETPKAHAARLGMYGAMTREVEPWIPAKLLCKRFGVKEPEPDPLLEPALPSTSAPSATTLSAAEEQLLAAPDASFRSALEGNQDSSGSGGGGKRDLSNIGLGEDDTQGQDTLTYERPAMDIFKAIFASDDEDSDVEDNNKEGDAPIIGRTDSVSRQPSESATHDTAIPLPVPVTSLSLPTQVDSRIQPVNDEKVDLATFKPTFVPRGERSTIKSGDSSSRKDKKDKKRKKSDKVLVSFGGEDEDGDDGPLKSKDPEKPKKKKHKGDKHHRDKHRSKNDTATEEDDMWIEKPPPEVVKSLDLDHSQDLGGPRWEGEDASSTARNRKRAIDFM